MWWFGLALAASAGTMRATVEVGPDGPVVVDLVESSASPRFLPGGALEVVDGEGRVLGSAAIPDPRIRTVITPEGGESVLLERARIDVLVPWPEGAHAVQVGGHTAHPRTLPSPPPGTAGVHLIQEAGSSASRLDLVFLAEGYTANQLDDFADDVDWIVGYLQTIEPYADYTTLLNIWRVDVPSNQSGADHPETNGPFRDTALDCYYGCGNIDRLLCCDDNAVMDLVLSTVPDAEGVMVLVNDPTYGGAGGFSYATSYVGRDFGHQVAAHELGHSLVGLWDEYGYGTSGYGSGPNCSPSATPPWTEWVGTDGVSAFQECSYTGHYRPTENECMMRTLSDDYCPVCRQEVVRAMYSRIPGIITGVSPELDSVVTDGEVTLEAVVPNKMLTFEWTVDGEIVSDAASFEVPCGEPGGELRVTVRDDTRYVRADPELLLQDSTGPWIVEPPKCTNQDTAETLAEICGCDSTGSGGWFALLVPLVFVRRRR